MLIPVEGNLGVKAIKAEFCIPSNLSPLFIVHASPPGTVSRVITLVCFIQVLVITLKLEPLADSAKRVFLGVGIQ